MVVIDRLIGLSGLQQPEERDRIGESDGGGASAANGVMHL